MKRILAALGSMLSLFSAVLGIINGTYGFLKISRDHPILQLDVMYVDVLGARWGSKLLGDSSMLSYSELFLPGILILVAPILSLISLLLNKKSGALCFLTGGVIIGAMIWWLFILPTISEVSAFITSPWMAFDGSKTVVEIFIPNVKYYWNLGLGFYLCFVGALMCLIAAKSSK